MVSLVFTGVVGNDPFVRNTDNGNTIATFPVDVKAEPHLPPTRILVIALGKQALYAREAINKDAQVMVSGWFLIERTRNGREIIEVKAKHLRALVPSAA
jgi:hypothetical protein